MPDAPAHLQVVDIQPEAKVRQAKVVEILEHYLEKARAGRYDSILLVADLATTDDVLDYAYTATGDLVGLVGRLERLKHITLRRMDPDE